MELMRTGMTLASADTPVFVFTGMSGVGVALLNPAQPDNPDRKEISRRAAKALFDAGERKNEPVNFFISQRPQTLSYSRVNVDLILPDQ
jgi:hypothetical protein